MRQANRVFKKRARGNQETKLKFPVLTQHAIPFTSDPKEEPSITSHAWVLALIKHFGIFRLKGLQGGDYNQWTPLTFSHKFAFLGFRTPVWGTWCLRTSKRTLHLQEVQVAATVSSTGWVSGEILIYFLSTVIYIITNLSCFLFQHLEER